MEITDEEAVLVPITKVEWEALEDALNTLENAVYDGKIGVWHRTIPISRKWIEETHRVLKENE